MTPRYQQPWLHELEISVHGNATCLSDRAGDLGEAGTGLFVDDRRVISRMELRCDGEPPVVVASHTLGGTTAVVAVARHLGDAGPDPTVEVHRERRLTGSGMTESIVVRSRAQRSVETTLSLRVAGDGAELAAVKGGRPPAEPLPAAGDGAAGLAWADERHRTRVEISGGSAEPQAMGGVLSWPVVVEPGGDHTVEVTVRVERVAPTQFDAEPGGHLVDWSPVRVRAQDRRLDLTAEHSLADLAGLLLSDPDRPSDVFAAAGSPWYLTLFGRDALWAARLMLPFGTDLAGGTLRTLARRQGRREDPASAEEPGKILHEVRRSGFADPSSHLHLPPVYFGTVDATPLWVCLLHEAWRWGLPVAEVAELRPALEAALGWLARSSQASPDGFLRYVDETGTGLSNQGWKDSGDAMRFRDGSIASAPIALVETQAYAVDAARRAADLLETVHDSDGSAWRAWADELAARVRDRFWVTDERGAYLAMALDRDGRPVDGVGSNMGHVLGTGLLEEKEAALVAARMADPDLLGSYGLRTLSTGNPAYNPIGYHTGSVWTHDSAIAAWGLGREGYAAPAARLVRALVDAATYFGFRFPELYGDDQDIGRPVPYPAACRPQAWSAASAAAVVTAVLGVSADVPRRRLRFAPLRPSPFGETAVEGLRVAGELVSVRVAPDGSLAEVSAPGWLEVELAEGA